jgi:predicted acetyltransferase
VVVPSLTAYFTVPNSTTMKTVCCCRFCFDHLNFVHLNLFRISCFTISCFEFILILARTSRSQKDYCSRGVAEYAEIFFIINFFTPRLCVSACKKIFCQKMAKFNVLIISDIRAWQIFVGPFYHSSSTIHSKPNLPGLVVMVMVDEPGCK